MAEICSLTLMDLNVTTEQKETMDDVMQGGEGLLLMS